MIDCSVIPLNIYGDFQDIRALDARSIWLQYIHQL